MFRIHAQFFLPVAPRDNHPAAFLTRDEATGVACLDKSPTTDFMPHPFLCTRVPGHANAHQAGVRIGSAFQGHPARPVTPDAILVIAEWDDGRDTDGFA